jgi:hypothetical protein
MPGWAWARRQTRALRDRHGPEYDRPRAAESERAERLAELEITPLPPGARERYVTEWQRVQARFVDDPQGAAREADMLIQSVMQDRGYPADDFDQRAADVSVDHPGVVEAYREAHRLTRAGALGDATTEELRRAMQHYRALFDELVEERASATPDAAIAARS